MAKPATEQIGQLRLARRPCRSWLLSVHVEFLARTPHFLRRAKDTLNVTGVTDDGP
jgi:hypothetical protein